MGLGDEIMALGQAQAMYEATGEKVAICDVAGRPRKHEIWRGAPFLSDTARIRMVNCSGHRPYIRKWEGHKAYYNLNYKARAGTIYLSEQERDFVRTVGRDYVVVAPFVKENAAKGKEYPHWQRVIDRLDADIVQLVGGDNWPVLSGVRIIHTPTARLAAAAISGARLVLTNEGGSHHMAAAFGVPAVVYFGEFVPPSVTGYDIHINITVNTEHGYCGNFGQCDHCEIIKNTIHYSEIVKAARVYL